MQNTKETTPPNIHLAVQNFGPIARANLDLRPLTVFVGESNTGKTYLAALIYALHRTFLLCHCAVEAWCGVCPRFVPRDAEKSQSVAYIR